MTVDGSNAWNMINQAIMMSGSKFSRDLESEADAYGLTLMARAGYPPARRVRDVGAAHR